MKELQELRNEILMLRNYDVINKAVEISLLSKLNSIKKQLNLSSADSFYCWDEDAGLNRCKEICDSCKKYKGHNVNK